MFGILAIVAFLLDACLIFLGAVGLPVWLGIAALGLAFLSVHATYPWTPWRRVA